jgi:hypothetical protein
VIFQLDYFCTISIHGFLGTIPILVDLVDYHY